jgi:hypothetical protein
MGNCAHTPINKNGYIVCTKCGECLGRNYHTPTPIDGEVINDGGTKIGRRNERRGRYNRLNKVADRQIPYSIHKERQLYKEITKWCSWFQISRKMANIYYDTALVVYRALPPRIQLRQIHLFVPAILYILNHSMTINELYEKSSIESKKQLRKAITRLSVEHNVKWLRNSNLSRNNVDNSHNDIRGAAS